MPIQDHASRVPSVEELANTPMVYCCYVFAVGSFDADPGHDPAVGLYVEGSGFPARWYALTNIHEVADLAVGLRSACEEVFGLVTTRAAWSQAARGSVRDIGARRG